MADFVWGQDDDTRNRSRNRVAEALLQQASDTSPIRSWTQGLARVAQGLLAGKMMGDDDKAERDSTNILLNSPWLNGGGSTAGTPAASISTSPSVGSAPVASADTTDRIYKNDEPSPLDPPSGADKDMITRTVAAEAANQPFAGQVGVAASVRNRAADGGFGGDTIPGVIQKPAAYEPWNTPEGRARMAAIDPNSPQYQTAGKAVDAAYYGTDPTSGATHFVAPKAQAALGRPMPSWATGDSTTIGDHVFYSPDDAKTAALPPNAQPTQGQGALPRVAQALVAGAPQLSAQPQPAAQQPAIPPDQAAYIKRLIANPQTRAAGVQMLSQYAKPVETYSQVTDAAGNVWNVNDRSHQRTVALQAKEDPTSVREYQYYQEHLPPGTQPMDYGAWSTQKARAGATNVNTNVDMGSGQTYDKQLAEGLGKSHAALSNGVEDAQARARDIAAMQGAIDAIQKNGGTTGGMAAQTRLDLQKTINAGASSLGIDQPFNENDLSDKEFLTKFNRSMAGAQAKNAVGSRVTNFEMSNFLKANPGLDMSVTGNQRLLGIQAQIEQRNIAVGNAIRNATADAIANGKKVDPRTVQGIISDYDQSNHVKDPVTGQDLTQSYTLPDFQGAGMGTNSGLAVGHETNINGIRVKRVN